MPARGVRVRPMLLQGAAVVLLGLSLACTAPRTRAFFVIPQELPGGESSEPQRVELEQWLAQRAGGFTRLGAAEGAWLDPQGRVVTETNHAYLVSVKEDPRAFERELRTRILRDFRQQEAYVERW